MSSVASGSNTNTGNDSTDNSRSTQNTILTLAFNQDCTALSVGTVKNYVMYTINSESRPDQMNECGFEPDVTRHYLSCEGVRIIERLFLSALIAVVSQHEPKKLRLLHYRKGTEICAYSYGKPILSVKLNRQRAIVCLEDSIYLHSISNMKVLHRIYDSLSNPDGLCALSCNESAPYLAYPESTITGKIQVFDTEKLKPINAFSAHESPLVAMSFDPSGLRIATASNRGTVIRVHNVVDGTCVIEFRRGSMRAANIYSLAFSPDSMFLAASSNTETIHVFRLPIPSEQPVQDTATWTGYFASYLPRPALNVLAPGRSFATVHFKIGEIKRTIAMKIVNQQLRLFAADHSGIVSVYEINTVEGGECRQISQYDVLSAIDNTNNEQNRRSSVSNPINVTSPSKYPPNQIRNGAYELPRSSPILTNTNYQTNQSFDTAIEEQPLSSTPQTDYD